MAGTCSVRQCRRLVRRCLAAASVPRSELCRESIVWHEGREARPGSASQDGGGAAGLSCRAGPARGRGDADGGAEEQQVSQGWLVEQTAWSTELSPGGLAYFLQ